MDSVAVIAEAVEDENPLADADDPLAEDADEQASAPAAKPVSDDPKEALRASLRALGVDPPKGKVSEAKLRGMLKDAQERLANENAQANAASVM